VEGACPGAGAGALIRANRVQSDEAEVARKDRVGYANAGETVELPLVGKRNGDEVCTIWQRMV